MALEASGQLVVADFTAGGPPGDGSVFRVNVGSGAITPVIEGEPLARSFGVAVEPPRCGGRLATVVGSSGPNRIRASRFADVIATLGGRDRVIGAGRNDIVCGGKGPDLLWGGKGADRLLGGPGNDRLVGGRGNDRIRGGPGNDRLLGGPGRDRLLAGKGRRDRCQGGPGRDRAAACERGR